MALLFFDNFDGADANPIGSPYTTVTAAGADVRRNNNLAKGSTDATRSIARISTITLPARHRVEVTGGSLTLDTADSIRIGVIAGYRTSDGAFVYFGADTAGTIYLGQFTGSFFLTEQASAAYTYTTGDTLSLEVQADGALIGRVNGTTILTGSWTAGGLSGSPGDQGGIWVRGLTSELQSVALYSYETFNPLSGRGGGAAQPLV